MKEKTYQGQYKRNCSLWKPIVLGELRMYNAIVIFVLEPNLVDKGLYKRGTKYASFQYGILPVPTKILTVRLKQYKTDNGSPYK